MRHFQCLKSSAGNSLAVEKGPGSIAPLWAELWPFKEGNRQRRTKSEANVTDFVNHFQTRISQAWNGLLRHFQCLKSSAGNSLAVEKGPRSIAPQGAELWPFKEGYRLLNFSKIGDNCSSVFKHSFLRPGVEFCKNSKTQNHQNEVLLPWNRHPGQWELWKASYSRIE